MQKNFERAMRLFMQIGRWSPDDANQLKHPTLDPDINTVKTFDRYQYFPVSVTSAATINVVCDNNFVGIHSASKGGEWLSKFSDFLCALLQRRPEYTDIVTKNWQDGSFRIGYRFNERMKAMTDDEKVLIIYLALMDTADMAEKFAIWNDHQK